MPFAGELLQSSRESFVERTTNLVRQYRAKLDVSTNQAERELILTQVEEWEQQLAWGGRKPQEVSEVAVLKSEVQSLKDKLLSLMRGIDAPKMVEKPVKTAVAHG